MAQQQSKPRHQDAGAATAAAAAAATGATLPPEAAEAAAAAVTGISAATQPIKEAAAAIASHDAESQASRSQPQTDSSRAHASQPHQPADMLSDSKQDSHPASHPDDKSAPNQPPASEQGPMLSVDRSGMIGMGHQHVPHDQPVPGKQQETEMARHLKGLIRFRSGPVTVAEYMSEALTNPNAGYYIQRSVFGAAGDFVTSPEISQMFGEVRTSLACSTFLAASFLPVSGAAGDLVTSPEISQVFGERGKVFPSVLLPPL